MISEPGDEKGSSVSRLLAERAKLEELIRREHTRDVTVFFSDIKGYTTYTENRGDLAGRALTQRVNDLAFPLLQEHGGILVKTIGDAIMAYFAEPRQSIIFAVALQRAVKESNAAFPSAEQVQLRMGLNKGEVILDSGDLYGDAVNVAARIEPQARPNGILISPALYNAVEKLGDVEFRFAKRVTMKGKAKPLDLYQVVWDGDRYDDYTEAVSSPGPSGQPHLSDDRTGAAPRPAYSALRWAGLAGILIMAALVMKFSIFGSNSGNKEISRMDPYSLGYSLLRKKAINQASAEFAKLARTDPRYSETQTALAVWQRDFSAAESLLGEALTKGDDRVFVHVLEGDVRMNQAQQDKALDSYKKAIGLNKGLDWQRALAYNGQGRILAAMNRQEEALASYSEASRLAQDDSGILTNYAVMLERAGKTAEALPVYQKALRADPDDILAKKKMAMAERSEKARLDKEKQERIDKLVAELVAQFKAGNASLAPAQGQAAGITFPAAVWLLQFEDKGDLPVREGENDVFVDLLGQKLQESGDFLLVERNLIDSMLVELKLGSSRLADRETSLKLGRLLAAKLMITGSVFRRGQESLISFKVIETETGRILAAASLEASGAGGLFPAAPKVAEEIQTRLAMVLPIRAVKSGRI